MKCNDAICSIVVSYALSFKRCRAIACVPKGGEIILVTLGLFAAFDKDPFKMMRPDHIFLAMTMIKHGTLAGAFIFGFKLVAFAVKSL